MFTPTYIYIHIYTYDLLALGCHLAGPSMRGVQAGQAAEYGFGVAVRARASICALAWQCGEGQY